MLDKIIRAPLWLASWLVKAVWLIAKLALVLAVLLIALLFVMSKAPEVKE